MNAIEIRGLTKKYKSFTLDNINLTLPQGCIMGLIGQNGAGKSTTIKLLLDIIHADGGTVTLLGKSNKDNLHLTKEDIGVVLDEVGIPEKFTPEQVRKVMKLTFRNWDDALYYDYLRKFGLDEKKKFKTFSKGMKMKLGLAIALSHHPKLLILDEATAGLDPVIRDELLDLFCDFTRDETNSILISSHIISDLEKICDYIAFMHKGRLILVEEKDRLKENYALLHLSVNDYNTLDPRSVIGRKETPYGIEAIVRKDTVNGEFNFSPIDIEQLFIYMTKEVKYS